MDLISGIKPPKEEEEKLKKVSAEIIKKLKKIKIISPIIGGSVSKDTWLKGTNEIDIYAKFNYKKFKDKNDEISNLLFKELKKIFKNITRVHGSRDYFHLNCEGYTIEIVPILDIKKPEQALNVTDLSPMHINFVKKYSKLKNEIRLLKAFCKANSLYGAESYISGFSGYAIEVLVIYYKSFKNVLKNSLKWKEKTVVDFFKKLKNPLLELNPSKTVSPLIVIDPVDKTRNITSSLNSRGFNKFKELAKKYLKNPSETFFHENEKIPSNAVILVIDPLEGKKDIVGDKIVKTINYIKNELTKNGFEIKSDDFKWNKEVIFWLEIKNKNIPKNYIRKGPPVEMISHVKEFKKKNKKTFVKNKICYAEISREFIDVKDLLKKLIKEKYVRERVRGIKIES